MRYCIQCTDDRTGKTGDFAFTHGRYINGKIRYYSLTPVFNSLVELFNYCKENNIILQHSINKGGNEGLLETGTNKPLQEV